MTEFTLFLSFNNCRVPFFGNEHIYVSGMLILAALLPREGFTVDVTGKIYLTFVLLNPDIPFLCKQCRFKISEEAN